MFESHLKKVEYEIFKVKYIVAQPAIYLLFYSHTREGQSLLTILNVFSLRQNFQHMLKKARQMDSEFSSLLAIRNFSPGWHLTSSYTVYACFNSTVLIVTLRVNVGLKGKVASYAAGHHEKH